MWRVVLVCGLLVECALLTDVHSFYSVLGVERSASTLQVRQAYKKLAVKLHPDKNPDEAVQEQFLKITEAYETLRDEDKRREYDERGDGAGGYRSRQYAARSPADYNTLYYDGLYAGDEFVDSLSPHTYHKYLTEGLHFIKFYSPFCPPCQTLSDHWRTFAQLYKGIVKVGAVNCKYHNSFCYDVMRISRYPTLLLYPRGGAGEAVPHEGERTLAALELHVQRYMRAAAPVHAALQRAPHAALYVLGTTRIPEDAVLRIAYRLRGVVSVHVVEEEGLREELSGGDPRVQCALQLGGGEDTPLYSEHEADVVRDVLARLPAPPRLDPPALHLLRDELRNGSGGRGAPWVLHLTSPGAAWGDTLLLYKMAKDFPDIRFGVVECGRWAQQCASLGAGAAGAGAWGALKAGGAWEVMPGGEDVAQFVRTAPFITNLHSLTESDAAALLADGGGGGGAGDVWLVGGAGARGALGEAARHHAGRVQVGWVRCGEGEGPAALCGGEGVVLVDAAGRRHWARGGGGGGDLVRFVDLLLDDPVEPLSEQQVLEVQDAAARGQVAWLVAFVPRSCADDIECDSLLHQWRLVADKVRALRDVRVGLLHCARGELVPYCVNVRAPTARVYPPGSAHTYVANMQHVSTAAHLLQWSLQHALPPPAPPHLTAGELALRTSADAGPPLLVYYHSPRCYRCYELYADFAIAHHMVREEGEGVAAARVDCARERALCQREGVTSYPALRLYRARAPPRPLPLAHHDALAARLRDVLAGGEGGHDVLAGGEGGHDEL